MIIGIGNDLIEIHRVSRACEKESFLTRIFTADEIVLIRDDKKRAAGNFAVKEAVSKMFGTGFRGFKPIEIEVLRDHLGRPYVRLHGEAKKMAERLDIQKIHVSISNTKEFASAVVVGETLQS
ncbi:MAG: holo-[acyl-carrier-protein] synthase [Lachnospiraceae bacterium]|nr:holo-[acyl-carrier-protein] synthase [Lachnospiraceae bacterium]